MAGAGWQFSVTVPSWTQTTLEGDDLVVVRVLMHLQSARAPEVSEDASSCLRIITRQPHQLQIPLQC